MIALGMEGVRVRIIVAGIALGTEGVRVRVIDYGLRH